MNKLLTVTIVMMGILSVTLMGCARESRASTPDPAVKGRALAETTPPPVAEPVTDGAPKSFDSPPKPGTKATCPVMEGEFVVTEKSERSEYKGRHVAFCCPGCKSKFDADPEKYLN